MARSLSDKENMKLRRAMSKANVASHDLNKAAALLRDLGYTFEADSLNSMSYRITQINCERLMPDAKF